MMNSRQWLADIPWELVVWQNLQLCNARSLAGHIVAGVASEEEVRAFEKFCAGLGCAAKREAIRSNDEWHVIKANFVDAPGTIGALALAGESIIAWLDGPAKASAPL